MVTAGIDNGTSPHNILRARIALLATAIGGPDYTSTLDPPPYKQGDDCLACLKDLKRWFKLVDDQQNRWDVAMAAAEYKVFSNDLIPLLIDWETKSSLASKLGKNNLNSDNAASTSIKNKIYFDKIALNCLQLMVLMTWPLIITDQSSYEQVSGYSELKKHQLMYKKDVLTIENGKVFKAVLRLAFNVIKIDRANRTARDNTILRLVLSFLRNIIAIEPGELSITAKKRSAKGIGSTDTLPPNVSMDDISLSSVINCFHRNKVFKLILTLGSSLSTEFDQDFINLPLLEVMFYLTKDVNQKKLFSRKKNREFHSSTDNGTPSNTPHLSNTGVQLTTLLAKEKQLKTNVIKNTSSRHSRFGALLSIQTPDNGRLTISGTQGLTNDIDAMKKLDSSKKWNKRIMGDKDDVIHEGLPSSLLNSQADVSSFDDSTLKKFKDFINNFIDSSFNVLLKSVTNHFTTEQDQMVSLEQVEYLLFFAWFIKYQILRYQYNLVDNFNPIQSVFKETSFILMSSLLRTGVEQKNWIVAHAGMIAFNQLLSLTQVSEDDVNFDEIEYIISRLFSDDRIQLLANLPRIAEKHSIQFMKNAIELTHTILKTLQNYAGDRLLRIEGKKRGRKAMNVSLEDIRKLMERDNVGRDEAVEILSPVTTSIEINFGRVLGRYINDNTINTYLKFLERFRELEDDSIKKVISFFHRIFVDSKDEALLFRIDLMLLFRDMLASNGLPRSSSSRKYVDDFSKYYLTRLKKKLKVSPAWFIGILFPTLHDNEVGYYQRFGEVRRSKVNNYDGVSVSYFKPIENENRYTEQELLNLKFGILISSLLDDGKNELVDYLIEHLAESIDKFKLYATNNDNGSNPPHEYLITENENIIESTVRDKDFRALLQLTGYKIPNNRDEKCYIPGDIDIGTLSTFLDYIKFHKATPFETPNGKPSSTYLTRPNSKTSVDENEEEDGWNGNEEYDYTDASIINDNDYFKELQGTNTDLSERSLSKGIAKSKKKSKQRKSKGKNTSNNLPTFDVDGNEIKTKKSGLQISSKEFISDSEEDEELDPVFFENEMYMRLLLDKHNGQLPDDKYKQFTKFAEERMNNKGHLINDYSALFDGQVLDVKDLSTIEYTNSHPDLSLKSRTEQITQQLNEDDSSQETKNTAGILPETEIIQDSDAELDIPFTNNDTDLSDDDMNSSSDSDDGSHKLLTTKENVKKHNLEEDNYDEQNGHHDREIKIDNELEEEEVISTRKRQHVFIDEDD
ncbi:hypothetical protein TPHA_0B04510 [Tetrapisispora phaffii CBS 4417]|uniref:Topoisomerase 1-associated factor 1 n=1 Tax=Tetrapisispora phaffii (strain ATCC 24235 / CBS 4417 / NBRC 1672 / NRRL Y-8282 / UCD 70-5) TaxID=1071381 RepID=G8BQ39_TETPH|nr:hypothetical protein TPHA_0B04510 [Tetrapisispora phaffii CBS 4417]CCE62120.1 hypothetical protein TPHA_0B04510 [Tetrapisispora phaffii CBS 4417]